ncbi:MAG: hypothetical protein AAGE89_10580 [Pseudomonadota bacterium]
MKQIAIPVVFAEEIGMAAWFYCNKLGFHVVCNETGLTAQRDGMTLQIDRIDNIRQSGVLTALLTSHRIRDLHAEFLDRKVPTLTNLHNQRYRPLQFSLRDASGNHLIFTGPRPVLYRPERATEAVSGLH